jgi:hypothetical protein
MYKSLFIVIAIFIGISAHAQRGLITGVVLDEQNLSLPGATLKLIPGNQYTVSDPFGKFEFLMYL